MEANMEQKLGIIGIGNMGSAILKNILDNKIFDERDIIVNDKNKKSLEKFKEYNISFFDNIDLLIKNSDVIMLCVKPKDINEILLSSNGCFDKKLIISIAAGISIKKIMDKSKAERVIRLMPNLGCIVNESASAFCCSEKTAQNDKDIAKKIFGNNGILIEVDEKDMDIVTALSGSGPAFIAYFLKYLSKSALENGLLEESAKKLIVQTCIGTGKLLEKYTFDELIKMVSSPGGTTEQGLGVFNDLGTDKIVRKAVDAALKKSVELGKNG
jgi:pyrroline-5-carboxylate reductase